MKTSTIVLVTEVSAVDNGVSGLIYDVTVEQLKLDSAQHGCDFIITCGNVAVKGS